ncbi:MAG TPA: hypothetical protein DCQ31_07420 [Bacteroidales bacterium]|nr:hypothetical protein [Bacteroidales bacterium]
MKKFLANLRIRNKLLIGFVFVSFILLITGFNQYNVLLRLNIKKNAVQQSILIEAAEQRIKYVFQSEMNTLMQLIHAENQIEKDQWWLSHLAASDSLTAEFERFFKAYEVLSTQYAQSDKRIVTVVNEAKSVYDELILPSFANVNSLKAELEGLSAASVNLDFQVEEVDEEVEEFENTTAVDATKNIEAKIKNQQQIIVSSATVVIQRMEEAQALSTKTGVAIAEEASEIAAFVMIETIALMFFGLLLSVLISIYIANIIVAPVKDLKVRISKLAIGELPDNSSVDTKDEIGTIHKELNKVIDGMKQTSEFAVAIGKGKYASNFKPLSDKDVLGNTLLGMKQSLEDASIEEQKRKQEDEQRSWINRGVNTFSDILRKNSDDFVALADEVIINLVKYLKANQGGLFVVEENMDDKYLELRAAYAYNRKKYLEKRIRIGEGLIGMCALEKFTMHMTEIPENYIEIESGLGDANPSVLLIVPLKVENDVLGVIELAGFNKFSSFEIELAERIAENVAASLATAKINLRTAQLLEQSQKQAHEMQKQEETMRNTIESMRAAQQDAINKEMLLRRNFEKLTQAQRKLDEREKNQMETIRKLTAENESKLHEIEIREKRYRIILQSSINAVFVFDSKGNVQFINHAAELLTGYSYQDVAGNSFTVFLSTESSVDLYDNITEFLASEVLNIPFRKQRSRILSRDGNEISVSYSIVKTSVSGDSQIIIFMEDHTETEKNEVQRSAITEKLVAREFSYLLKISELESLLRGNSIEIPEIDDSVLLKWGDDFILNIDVIDKQHYNWINLINKLYAGMREGRAKDMLASYFDEIVDYTNYHFTFEEQQFAKFGFENETEHKEYHKSFINRILELKREFMQDKPFVVYELMSYLKEWVGHHVQVSDRSYVKLFKKKGMS